jgi:hypothetical protein
MPLKKCKTKIHDLESEYENCGILYWRSEGENLGDFDHLNEKKKKNFEEME